MALGTSSIVPTYRSARAVTASANPLPDGPCLAILITTTTTATVTIDGVSVTLTSAPANTIYPLACTHVTAGTGVFALY
jgi:hypothetical protein